MENLKKVKKIKKINNNKYMRTKIKLISITKLKSGKKKYEAKFEVTKSNSKISKKSTKFGAKGMSDYTIHKDKDRRNRYITRHTKDLRTNDPTRAGFLSMYILWNKPSYRSSLADYKKRLNTYNRTGKFPRGIPNSPLKNKFGNEYNSFGNEYNSFGNDYFYNLPPDLQRYIYQLAYIVPIIKERIKYINDKKALIEFWTPSDTDKKKLANIYSYDPRYDLTVETLTKINNFIKTVKNLDEFKEIVGNFIAGYCETIYDPSPTTTAQSNLERSKELITDILQIKFSIQHGNDFCENDEILRYFVMFAEDVPNENQFGKSKIPDNVLNKKLYQKIKNKIRRDVDKKNRRWGAYDSGRLVREYKAEGGKYSGTKKSRTNSKKSSNLDRWYKEKWIDACAWPKRKSCGRTKASIKSKVTYCRPSKIVDSNTPKTIQELTKAQIKRRCSKKSKNPKRIIR